MRSLLVFVISVVLLAIAPPVFAADGDPARGAEVYQRCIACHSLDRNRTGPKHCGIFGRAAGDVPGYRYSAALADSGIIWNAESLDRFLENPLGAVPGTRMGYAGVKDPRDRADLIAYLKEASTDPEKCR